MGHNRLGKIPTSRKWKTVVSLLDSAAEDDRSPSDDVKEIAKFSLKAAEHGLQFAIADEGLRDTFFILTKVAECAKHSDWQVALKDLGVNAENCTSAADLVFAINDALDDRLESKSRTTDVSEIARQAAGDALHSVFQSQQLSLFGDTNSSVSSAIETLASKKGYEELSHTFFAQFLSRYLNFYLSRATASATGRNRFVHTGDISAFNDALQSHCRQSALIVRDFCGSWYSKTKFREGINKRNTSGFLKVALGKLSRELSRQGRDE